MIITQTPFRMSFFGGGTDYRPYFEEYGGCVLSTTFDKYCYLTVRSLPPFFEHKSQFTYSKIERFNTFDEIEHPAVRECLREFQMENLHIMYDADLPARSGLGSSSSFAVGLYHALHALRGEYVDKMQLAKEAIHLEQELLKEAVGVQDQLAAAFGGLNRIDFTADGYSVKPITITKQRKKEFEDHLMLFFTGFVRFASEIATEQIKNTKIKIKELHEMKALVEEGEKILIGDQDICEFGKLLDHTWQLKRSLTNKISTNNIDEMYTRALEAGALGGKLLGAGGGGFILLFVEPEKQQNVKRALADLLHIPFRFENAGTKIMHYSI